MKNIIAAIKSFFNWLFGKGKKSDPKDSNPNVGIPDEKDLKRKPGLKCPECGEIIPIAINQLLQHQKIICNNCFLELDIVSEKSQEALNALQKLKTGMDQAEALKKNALGN